MVTVVIDHNGFYPHRDQIRPLLSIMNGGNEKERKKERKDNGSILQFLPYFID